MQQSTFTEEKQLLTIKEVSEILNISYSTLRRWDESWKLNSIRIWSSHRRYNIDDIKNHLASRRKNENT